MKPQGDKKEERKIMGKPGAIIGDGDRN